MLLRLVSDSITIIKMPHSYFTVSNSEDVGNKDGAQSLLDVAGTHKMSTALCYPVPY